MANYVYFSSTAVAEVAEVSVASHYSVRVHLVACAVDCGLVANPTIAETQIEGAVVMGLSAALKGEITSRISGETGSACRAGKSIAPGGEGCCVVV